MQLRSRGLLGPSFGYGLLRALLLSICSTGFFRPLLAAEVDETAKEGIKERIGAFHAYLAQDEVDKGLIKILSRYEEFPFLDLQTAKVEDAKSHDLAFGLATRLYKEYKIDVPCLKGKGPWPKITLIGEFHNCPNCAMESEKSMIEAAQGKSVLGFEGISIHFVRKVEAQLAMNAIDPLRKLSESEKAWKIEGVEDQLLKHFTDIYTELEDIDGAIAADPKNGDLKLDLKNFIERISEAYENEHFKVGTVLFKIAVDANRDLHLGDEFKAYLTAKGITPKMMPKLEDFWRKFPEVEQEIERDGSAAAYERHFSERFAEFNIQDARELFFHYSNFLLERKFSGIVKGRGISNKEQEEIYSLIKTSLETKNFSAAAELVSVTLRNLAFAANILKLYCQMAVPAGKDLVVQIGSAHLAGTAHLIKQAAPGLTVDPKNIGLDFLKMTKEERLKHLDGMARWHLEN